MSSDASLVQLHPQLRVLATKADRARDQVARLVQLLGSDPLNDPTRMSMFPWSVFLEHYNTVMHQLADLSTYLSSATPTGHPTPFASLFIHPSHALTPAEQTALYGGAFAVHDPPLRPIVGKPYADARGEAYVEFAEGLEALVEGKRTQAGVMDGALEEEYRDLVETAKIFRQTDDQVNFALLDPATTNSTTGPPSLETMLLRTRSMLETLKTRQEKARGVVDGLRSGFDWGMRIDPAWSAVKDAEERARGAEEDEGAEEEDAEGEEDEDEDEFEEVPAETGDPGNPNPPDSLTTATAPSNNTPGDPSRTTSSAPPKEPPHVIDIDDDDDDDLFGENDSSRTGGTPGTGKAIEDDEDEEMDQVA